MKVDGLTLRLEHDIPSGEATVHCEVRSHGFSGAGFTVFHSEDLRAFASALRAFPLGDEAARGLESGIWGDPNAPDRRLVAISAHPLDAAGHVGVRVRLGASLETWQWRQPLRHLVEVEFQSTYGALDRFAGELVALLDGTAEEALLLADFAT